MKWLLIVIGVVLILGGGFVAWWLLSSETVGQVHARYAPRYQPLREKLRQVAANLPPKGSVTGRKVAPALNPRPTFDHENRAASNTELMVYDQLLDPAVDLKAKKEFDPIVMGDLLFALQQMEPRPGMTVMSKDQSATSHLVETFERGLKTRYLAVVRPLHYSEPVALDRKTFLGGALDMEVFLVDFDSLQVLAWDRIQAKTAEKTTAVFRPGHDERKEVETSAHSTLWVEAMDRTQAALTQMSGGSFQLRRK